MKAHLRQLCWALCVLAVLVEVLSPAACGGPAGPDPLAFPVHDYTVVSKNMKTPTGEVPVTFHLYEGVTYVTDPVDPLYQNLNVCVPVEVDGVEVDATEAPILMVIGVAGYWSSKVEGTGGVLDINASTALTKGFVVVSAACRGTDNIAADGTYYGKAPAAIVDLKSAVKYLHHNDKVMPGKADWIVSVGGSAGGALSALLGASGNSDLYDSYFQELGVAEASDAIFASGCFCPIIDLEHADMAYEWMFGAMPQKTGVVIDQALSAGLKDDFAVYQASLDLKGKDGFGVLTADNYDEYLVQAYLTPAASKYLADLPDEERDEYLADNPWITWAGGAASFTWDDFLDYFEAVQGRKDPLPAFDSFNMDSLANLLFGDEANDGRYFTDYTLRKVTGDPNAQIDSELKTIVELMNPMYFVGRDDADCADNWWIRHGTIDNFTSLTVITNLAVSLENRGKNVDAKMYWGAKHGANLDPAAFIDWIGDLTGYSI